MKKYSQRRHSLTCGRRQYYTVYRSKTDEIVASGTAPECAASLGRSLASFYSLISNFRTGKNKRFEIEQEDYNEPNEADTL